MTNIMELHVHDPLSALITVALPMADPGTVENDIANIKNEIATAIEHPDPINTSLRYAANAVLL
jgi:hypothetical protein